MVFDNVDQFFDDLKVSATTFCLFDCSCHGISFNDVALQQKVLLKYGFARDERVELADGRFAEIDMLEQMLCRVQMYDETEHPLGNDADVSGPRAQTYQNESQWAKGSSANEQLLFHTSVCIQSREGTNNRQ